MEELAQVRKALHHQEIVLSKVVSSFASLLGGRRGGIYFAPLGNGYEAKRVTQNLNQD